MSLTPEQEAQKASEIVARRDIDDIKSLRGFEPFNRYFLRRIRQRAQEIEEQFRRKPRFSQRLENGKMLRLEICTHEDREAMRQILEQYDWILSLLDTDEGSAQNYVDRL